MLYLHKKKIKIKLKIILDILNYSTGDKLRQNNPNNIHAQSQFNLVPVFNIQQRYNSIPCVDLEKVFEIPAKESIIGPLNIAMFKFVIKRKLYKMLILNLVQTAMFKKFVLTQKKISTGTSNHQKNIPFGHTTSSKQRCPNDVYSSILS